MSDTPRTDQIYNQFGPQLNGAAMAYFSLCRELERECAANAEDKARIDWIDQRGWMHLPPSVRLEIDADRAAYAQIRQEKSSK